MTPFYNTQERREALIAEAESWIGTRWMDYCNVKISEANKGGVDCIRLAGSILENTGAIPRVDWRSIPKYTMDWSAHNSRPILEEMIEIMELRYQRVDRIEALQIGDVMAFAPGKVVYHLGIFTGRNQLIHAMQGSGANYIPLSEPTLNRFFRYAMRPIEEDPES